MNDILVLPLTLVLVSIMLTAAWFLGYYTGYGRGFTRGLAEKITLLLDKHYEAIDPTDPASKN